MKRFATEIDIAAPPETVWRLLSDASRYPEWNPTVTRIDGSILLGQKITVHARISAGKAFPVRVNELTAPSRMVWVGGMPLGLFRGTRTFTLDSPSGGTARFAMVEEYRGVMAGLIARSIPDLQPEFDAFAEALKLAAESV